MSANPENKTVLNVGGMTCNNCVRHVTEAVQSVPGVHSAVVSLETRRASVRWTAESQKNISAVVQAIQKAGYEAQLVESDEHPHDHSEHKLAGWQLNLWIGVLGTAPLMIGEWM